MARLSVWNLTSSGITLGRYFGKVPPGGRVIKDLTADQIEYMQDQLAELVTKEVIAYQITSDEDTDNNTTELPMSAVVGGDNTWTSGTGSPLNVVVGIPGDIYSRLNGGANTTLYVKESGVLTTTGWVAK